MCSVSETSCFASRSAVSALVLAWALCCMATVQAAPAELPGEGWIIPAGVDESQMASSGRGGGGQGAAASATHSGVNTPAGMEPLGDDELGAVTGQALFVMDMIEGDGTLEGGTAGLNFHRAGLDVELDLNMNIKELELGRTSGNPGELPPGFSPGDENDGVDPGVDLLAENVAFGCLGDGAGNCVNYESGLAQELMPLQLLRPYLEFAIENDGNPADRRVVGLRLGAEGIQGPLSFGQMKVFSGYLTATAQLSMTGQEDVAATCSVAESGAGTTTSGPFGGCPRSTNINTDDGLGNTGANIFSGWENCHGGCDFDGGNWIEMGEDPNSIYTIEYMLSDQYDATTGGTLGLDNEEICSLGFCAQLAAITANIGSAGQVVAQSEVLDAVASGKRLTQATVLQPGLADLISDSVEILTMGTCDGNRWNSGTACTGGDWFPGLIRGPAESTFREQVCEGLDIDPCDDAGLNNTPLPYNLTNFHQVDVDGDALGLSFQSQPVRYPGYELAQGVIPAAVMEPGWSMYLPDAFFLEVVEPAGVFTNNIASGAAGEGDLVGLDPVYDNCWGSARFC